MISISVRFEVRVLVNAISSCSKSSPWLLEYVTDLNLASNSTTPISPKGNLIFRPVSATHNKELRSFLTTCSSHCYFVHVFASFPALKVSSSQWAAFFTPICFFIYLVSHSNTTPSVLCRQVGNLFNLLYSRPAKTLMLSMKKQQIDVKIYTIPVMIRFALPQSKTLCPVLRLKSAS